MFSCPGGADAGALGQFPVEALQFGQHDGALQRVHAPAHANAGVKIAARLAVDPNFAHRRGQLQAGHEIGSRRSAITATEQGLELPGRGY